VLQQATGSDHARLDGLVSGLDFANEANYRRFLTSTHAALAGLEQQLERSNVSGLLQDWAQRRRRFALAEDLGALGADAGQPMQGPSKGKLTSDEMLGTLYVLEGSRLGATVLAARAADSSSAAVRDNVRYLTHGRDGRFWRSFLSLLADASAVDTQPMIASAHAAFAIFTRAFEAQGAALR
jgi:heme oxygenase